MSALGGAFDDAQFGPTIAARRAQLAVAQGDHAGARASVDRALALIADTDDLARHMELGALALSIESSIVDTARLNGGRVPLATARVRAELIRKTTQAEVARVLEAGGRDNAVLALHTKVFQAQLARLTGAVEARQWAAIAEDPLADAYLVAEARTHQAGVLLARGVRGEAGQAIREAAELAARLDATPLSEQVAALARRARLDVAGLPRGTDPHGLTAREREVLVFLGNGLSNAQIAKALYVSEKTASVHVSNILRKLNLTGRAQAAAWYAAQRAAPANDR